VQEVERGVVAKNRGGPNQGNEFQIPTTREQEMTMAFDYQPPEYTHTLKNGQSITVRGLNVEDLGYLIRKHDALLGLVLEGNDNPADLIMKAPALAADIIACGAGERAAADKAARMPLGLQILLLTKIFELSMSEVDMGEFLGAVAEMLKSRKNPTPPNT
jgi:hypothetical protein